MLAEGRDFLELLHQASKVRAVQIRLQGKKTVRGAHDKLRAGEGLRTHQLVRVARSMAIDHLLQPVRQLNKHVRLPRLLGLQLLQADPAQHRVVEPLPGRRVKLADLIEKVLDSARRLERMR